MRADLNNRLLGGVLLFFTIVLLAILVGDLFPRLDLASRPVDGMAQIPHWLGPPGAIVAGALAIAVGDAAHVIYAMTFLWAIMLLAGRPLDRVLSRLAGLLFVTGSVAGMLQINLDAGVSNPLAGGLFGSFVAEQLLEPKFGWIGSNVIGVVMATIGVLLSTDFLLIHALLVLQRAAVHLIRGNLAIYEGARMVISRSQSTADALRQRRESRWAEEALEEAEALAAEEAVPAGRTGMVPGFVQGLLRRREAVAEEAPVDAAVAPAPAAANGSGRKKGARAKSEPQIVLHGKNQAQAALEPELEHDFEPDFEGAREPELPFDAVPDIDDAEQEAEIALETPAALAENLGPAQPTKKRQLELLPNDGSAKVVRRAKRKAQAYEELPSDYVYPKRYAKPSIELFEPAQDREIPNLAEKLRATSELLEDCLQTFGIEARVTEVLRGPTITRFELEPAPGVKVSRFLALADDITLALKAHRIRVEAPIPGKGRVGIEVPNQERDSVVLRELLESRTMAKGKGKLKLALGKDIAGEVQIADLCTMPHLLVAGATGAGKTVCVKALLASLLYQHTPDEVQLILIDPKMVELSIFNDIPHLITPVVVDPKKASTALQWLISEMEERYRHFADLRVRNIEVYNESVENGEIEMEGGEEEDEGSVHVVRKLPYIVCIIDELADLMMLARAEVEDCIARLAQLARAVGIHLIIATQRPSVDVLTGVIKANFPARLSFQVSSRVDSRCILDEIGAERLIGMGDLLYLPAGQSKPQRMQGAFVSDDEMNALVHYLKTQAPPQYRDEIENYGKSKDKLTELLEEDDPLFDEAVQVVLETGQASISMVQRRLRVGYTRAARLVDMMELKGIVGPHTGSKAREILVNTAARDDVA